MIKKLLNKFFRSFTFDYDRELVERYLSRSTDTYDLEQRIRDLDQNKKTNQYFI